jgi:hypothetical protein
MYFSIYQAIARRNRGRVWMTEAEESARECEFIAYSYFPDGGKICLQNIDFNAPHRCVLHHDGTTDSIELAPGEFRLLDFQRTPRNESV